MWLVLFKTLEGIPYYGDEPDVPKILPDPRVEMYNFNIDEKHYESFEEDFVEPVDKLCDALLDFSEADYLGTRKCAKLREWLEERLVRDVPEFLKPIYEKMFEFTSKAIEYDTGIIIQL